VDAGQSIANYKPFLREANHESAVATSNKHLFIFSCFGCASFQFHLAAGHWPFPGSFVTLSGQRHQCHK
jgi:hypothetical protein